MATDIGIEDLLAAHRGLDEIISSSNAEESDGDVVIDVTTLLSEGLNKSISSQVLWVNKSEL